MGMSGFEDGDGREQLELDADRDSDADVDIDGTTHRVRSGRATRDF